MAAVQIAGGAARYGLGGLFGRLFPRIANKFAGNSAKVPFKGQGGIIDRTGAAVRQGLYDLSRGRTARALNVTPYTGSSSRAVEALPVGLLPRFVASNIRYAPATIASSAAMGVGSRGYTAYRDRQLPELVGEGFVPPTEEESIQRILDAFRSGVIDPQMAALEQFVGGDWEANRRQALADVMRNTQEWGESRALGQEESGREFAASQQARLDALDRLSALEEQVGAEQIAEGRAAVEEALVGGERPEGSDLVPLPGYLRDMPQEFQDAGELSAREALDQIISSGAELRTGAARGADWGQRAADEFRNELLLQQRNMQFQGEAGILRERERRQEMALMHQLGLEGRMAEIGFDERLTGLVRERSVDERMRAIASDPVELLVLKRDWQRIMDPSLPFRGGPLGRKERQEREFLESRGITTFEEYVRYRARQDVERGNKK